MLTNLNFWISKDLFQKVQLTNYICYCLIKTLINLPNLAYWIFPLFFFWHKPHSAQNIGISQTLLFFPNMSYFTKNSIFHMKGYYMVQLLCKAKCLQGAHHLWKNTKGVFMVIIIRLIIYKIVKSITNIKITVILL